MEQEKQIRTNTTPATTQPVRTGASARRLVDNVTYARFSVRELKMHLGDLRPVLRDAERYLARAADELARLEAAASTPLRRLAKRRK